MEKIKLIIREEYSRLIEKRSHPETNKKVRFMDFFNENKDKFKQKNMFLSFRDDLHVTNINLDNKYSTPTGFYTYPLCYFNLDRIKSLDDFREKFPYASEKRYLYLYELNTDKGVINNDISFYDIFKYVRKIVKILHKKEGFDKIYKEFSNNELGDYSSNAQLLYNFINKASSLTKNHQSNFTNICNSVGINGFIDNGIGYIHPNEPTQAVFFSKLKQNGVLKIYDTKDDKISPKELGEHIDDFCGYEIYKSKIDGYYNFYNKNGIAHFKTPLIYYHRIHGNKNVYDGVIVINKDNNICKYDNNLTPLFITTIRFHDKILINNKIHFICYRTYERDFIILNEDGVNLYGEYKLINKKSNFLILTLKNKKETILFNNGEFMFPPKVYVNEIYLLNDGNFSSKKPINNKYYGFFKFNNKNGQEDMCFFDDNFLFFNKDGEPIDKNILYREIS